MSRYVRGIMAALLWLGSSQAVHAQTTVEYIHTDALGTPIAVTDANKVVIETTEYEPYGAQVAGPVKDGPGYTGHVQDVATGLTYMQQRYYDPQVGVFLSGDPVTAYDRPIAGFNRYRYAANNPYKFTDPDGRCETTTGSRICGGGAGNNVSVVQVNPSSIALPNANSNPSSSQQLNAATISNAPTGAQGTDELVREWSLSQPSSNGGAVIQDITITVVAFDANGNKINTVSSERYWEAWTVAPGGTIPTPYSQDTFRINSLPSGWASGTVTWSGHARFYEGLALPSSFVPGGVGSAGVLPATRANPLLDTSNATAPVIIRFQTSWP